jgi:hypothetical protein
MEVSLYIQQENAKGEEEGRIRNEDEERGRSPSSVEDGI